MSGTGSPTEIADSLKVVLTDGKGKKVYDSSDKIPDLGFPTKPLTFCPNCGGDTVPVVYMCKSCGIRYIQQEDKKTGRKLLVILGENEGMEQAEQKGF
jgi:hypothetical protein